MGFARNAALCRWSVMASNDAKEPTANSVLPAAADGPDCRPCGTCHRNVQFLCYFMHRLLDFRHAEIASIASLGGSNSPTESNGVSFDQPCGGSYLSPFWYVWLPSEDSAKTVAKRSLLVKVRSYLHEAWRSVALQAISFGAFMCRAFWRYGVKEQPGRNFLHRYRHILGNAYNDGACQISRSRFWWTAGAELSNKNNS